DHYWDALVAGGEPGQCGWLKDQFGVSWQIVPDGLRELLGDPDPKRAAAAHAAMMRMRRLDLAAMRAAADDAARG
ncbi:MAG: VOC family protein, partial [Actinomycetes bacterium]